MESGTSANPPFDEKDREINQDLEGPTCNASADTLDDVSHQFGDGFWAWLQVISAFFVFFNTWGLLLGFGALQTYYEQDLLSSSSSSAISWIASICAFLLLFSGLVTGPLYDYGYLRSLLICGSILETFGLMMTSLAHKYYQVFLAQGICVGLGGGMLYVPSIAAVSAGFKEAKRPLVFGIIGSGAGIGGVVYPIIFRQLQPRLGFRWTVRILAFLLLFGFLFTYAVLPLKPKKSTMIRHFVDPQAFKDVPFMLFVLGGFFGSMGYYIPLIYLPSYAETLSLNMKTTGLAFYLLAIVNGTSTIGRILAGFIAVRLGPLQITTFALFCCAILLFSWIAVRGSGGIVSWSVIWGLVSSVIVALPGAIIPLLCPSTSIIGTRTGMYWAVAGLGILIGSPVAGALIVSGPAGKIWWHLQVFAGLCMVVGTALLVYPSIYAAKRMQSRNKS